MSDWFAGYEVLDVPVGDGIALRARIGGNPAKPPLLLLHGYPQTHVMWRRVAERLAPDFRLVLPDLRGYGDSTRPAKAPPPAPQHAAMSKRAMAADMAALMTHLGHERFAVAGHDRGGRVAYRLAFDHPQRVERLALLDIVPTLDMYEPTTRAFATGYYHWFFFIQPEPLPERLIGADAKFFLHWSLGGWGSRGLAAYEPQALAEYERCFCTPETIHATCEDYRAGATLDCEHELATRAAGQRIACPLLVLWGARGLVARVYDPLALWRAQCAFEPEGAALDAGHFIPEEQPEETARRLGAFFGASLGTQRVEAR
jgi:haloacetate dehalogenase